MKPNSLARVLSLLLLTTCSALAAEQPPNVVLIFADDLGYGDLGCYGASKVQTPNIDRLAAEGRRFTDAHSVSAVCTPSRYALLTGQYPLRAHGGQGVWGPAPVTSPLIVDTEKTTIADVFKNRGYHTAAIGKWHLGFKTGKNDWQQPLSPGPQDLGFDYYFGMPVVNSAPPYVYVENDHVVGGDPADPLVHLGRNAKGATPIIKIPPEAAQRSPNQFGGATEAHRLFNDYQVGTTLAKKSVDWINERKNKPFFLYLATTNIHHPFTPAKRFQGTSQCGLYGDFIHELDWIVGEILSCLDDNGLSDNTLVVFTSDNGGMFNHGGQAAFAAGHRQNGDLLGFKFGVWEGGHRVPLIVRWPGKVKAGTTSNQLIGNVDMLATFAAITQQKLDEDQQIDSVNMLPAFVGEPETPLRDHLVLAPHKGTHLSVRKGNWMYIPARGSGGFTGSKPGVHTFAGPPAASFVGSVNSDIENGKIKKDAPLAQLYDLENDVSQTENVYRDHPTVAKSMEALLDSYRPKRKKPERQTAPVRRRRARRNPQTAVPSAAGTPAAALSTSDASGTDPSKPNFVIIFTSDNGPAIGSAGPLRGRKGSTFEGGMRESTVIRWPGKIPAGETNDELMTTMDLLPTFAKLAGAEVPTDRVIDGKDIWSTLTGKASTPHQAFFYHRGNSLNAVRIGKWKLHANMGKPTQLYDLEGDIGEKQNVIESNPEVVQRLTRHLKAFAQDIANNSRPAAFVENPKPLSK